VAGKTLSIKQAVVDVAPVVVARVAAVPPRLASAANTVAGYVTE
jgi:hypothetical protein